MAKLLATTLLLRVPRVLARRFLCDLLLLLLGFGCFAAHQVCQRHVFANSNCKSVSEGTATDLLSFQSGDLRGERARIEIAVAKLPIEVRSPGVDGTFAVDSSGETTLLLANLNISEVYSVHTNLLRRTENSELASAPND